MLTRDQIQSLSADQLEAEVKRHNHLYWNDHEPEIPDEIYDQLVERLRTLRPEAAVLDAIGPAGADEDALGFGDKVEHARPMLSLDKAYDEQSVQRWFDRFEGPVVASYKIDGLACSLRYDAEGQLSLAATRGNGVRGDVITEQIKRVADIPHAIEAREVEVRGEVYMPLSVFQQFEGTYANPRNLAAGAIKQKDPTQTGRYGLRFFAYDLDGEGLASEQEKFARLRALGFTPVEIDVVGRDDIQALYDAMVSERVKLDYETDGVVLRTDRVDEQARLGSTAHHPRYAIAYKFQGEAGASRLVDVHWSVSRTGAINPVAVVEPVQLSGATVTRATLHNLAFMEGLKLTLGAKVLMMRRGGVIPHVERVVEPGVGQIAVPETCPYCEGGTERRGDFLYCVNAEGCRPACIGLLKHYIDGIECKGFGPRIIEQLFDQGMVQTPADFYELEVGDMLPLERMGETLARKLLDNLRALRRLPLAHFLRALGIASLGTTSAKVVAEHFTSLAAVRAASADDIAQIHGLGALTGQAIAEGLAERAEAIDRLIEHVEVVDAAPADEAVAGVGVLAGAKFLFTGALKRMKRKEAQLRVKALGGETPSGVARDLDYLVLGDDDLARFQGGWRSAKLRKADQLNERGAEIKIIGEQRFLELLGEVEAGAGT